MQALDLLRLVSLSTWPAGMHVWQGFIEQMDTVSEERNDVAGISKCVVIWSRERESLSLRGNWPLANKTQV